MPDLKRAGSVKDLVPVQKVIPEPLPNQGATLILRDGSFRMLLKVGSVNFDLKSDMEKDALTWAFGALCNSLDDDFPIQICPHSKRLDITAYLNQFDVALSSHRTPTHIKDLIAAHRDHLQAIVRNRNLLSRDFHVVIPWKGRTSPIEKAVTDEFPLAGLFKKFMDTTERRLTQHMPSDAEIASAQQQLDTRCANVQERLEQIGLWSQRLDEQPIKELLWELFHPARAERQAVPDGTFDGRMIGGFSAHVPPELPRRSDGRELTPPSF
jgi:hypothetical protein